MIYAKCIELKKLIVKYNRKQSLIDNCLHCKFRMFMDGEWSCTLRCNGCVNICDFHDIYNYIATFSSSPFMYGFNFGFRVHIQ